MPEKRPTTRGATAWHDRDHPVREPGHGHLGLPLLDRAEDGLRDPRRLDHEPAEEPALEHALLREPLRLDEPREHRVDRDPAPAERGRERTGERELGVLRGGVRSRGREGRGARHRDEVHDVRAARLGRGAQAGHEGTRAPDAAEVVHLDNPADEVEVDREERAACGDPGVVHEQVHRGVPVEDPRREGVHLVAVGDVAKLDLAADLRRERAQPVLPAGDEDAPPPAPCEQPRDRLSDPRRGAGHDRDPPRRLLVVLRCGAGGGHEQCKLQVVTCGPRRRVPARPALRGRRR